MKRIAAIGIVFVGLLAASCATGLPATAQPAPEVEACTPDLGVRRDVAYGPARLQRLDVYPAPAAGCGQNPVVLWVHGGGFRTGDKARLQAKRAWARANGWVLISVNYRLSDPSVPAPRRVRYPTHARDVGRAVAWAHDHVADHGGDPDRLALIGHSAGAQIVSTLGTDHRMLRADVRPSLCGVVSLDTEGYDVAGRITDGGRGARLYRNAFGNSPAVWRDASPINHVDADDPAHLVVRRGTLHRQRTQAQFAGTLRAAGVPTTVVPTPGYDHGEVNRLLGSADDDLLTPRVEGFLASCFTV